MVDNKSESKQDYGTPPDFMGAVEERFGKMRFDLAAHAGNTKVPGMWYGPGSPFGIEDSLKAEWSDVPGSPDHAMWLNPPFKNIGPYAKKCAEQTVLARVQRRPFQVVMLVLASVGANWFREHVWGEAKVIFLNGRIKFLGAAYAHTKDCMLCVYDSQVVEAASTEIWQWRGPSLRASERALLAAESAKLRAEADRSFHVD